MGMGPGNNFQDNNYTNTYDYELNFTGGGNETETETGSGNETDFSLPIGFGASLGIIGLIISLLVVRDNKKNGIYIEPVVGSQREEIITNPNYDSHSIEIIENEDEDADGNYETICDTLYELAGENSN